MLCQPLNWEISARLEAAREVSGDFYDVISLDEGRLVGLVVGDVCDKGVGSALFMALFRSLIRAFAEQHVCADGRLAKINPEYETNAPQLREPGLVQSSIDISTLINTVYLTNQYINNHHHVSNMFTTLFFAVIDPANGNMAYINCGHEPPLLINNRVVKERLNPTGPVLGILPDMKFHVRHVTMAPGDTLLAYTDGVIDALNSNGLPFSEERLLSLVQTPTESTEALLDKITASIQTHMGDQTQYDDIALLAARWVRADK
jgi:sigma-B regulation protein RsbU (phosphoserine phosphatase)